MAHSRSGFMGNVLTLLFGSANLGLSVRRADPLCLISLDFPSIGKGDSVTLADMVRAQIMPVPGLILNDIMDQRQHPAFRPE